mmetsp:Transcript_22348/g.33675  ORF Transcript_22348/g.33675 Transcript_22348/m.33675 type:complete len:212 (+) Transcript_22348:76-711(+)|eukprot:CAMPEP_0194575542 /NCGR_PEP_ID=MMETSP0292-20121207/10992_1 /TAXON_ID=39354 /ORGANISM="Heterosigma akashiwo, Strain CCMP2393" /LENGTH=211 /DNA_ID=CAMNT_0039427365 /DNA_START=166 /DNA_END=801 /DNA_ORIENTATION=-
MRTSILLLASVFISVESYVSVVNVVHQSVGRILATFKDPDASNCIEVGIGIIPIYEHCTGCHSAAALNCISDMRSNVSGNVPSDCLMDTMIGSPSLETGQCCASMLDSGYTDNDTKETIYVPVKSTAAYPDALLCLTRAGCDDTEDVYLDLERECLERCPRTDYIDAVCEPTKSPGVHSSRLSKTSAISILGAVSLVVISGLELVLEMMMP